MSGKTIKAFPLVSFILFMGFSAAAGALFYRIQEHKNKTHAPVQLPVLGEVAGFEFTERNGEKKTLADLRGKVWIADFIFTRCAGICPLMSGKMAKIQKELKASPGIRFVSFSVDPEYDTPEVLKRYAERYQADAERWFFLTGDKKQIFDLSLQHFRLGVGDIPEEDREALDQAVQHSSKFVLVDGEGKIRGYYSSEDEASLVKLAADAKELATEHKG
jgi:protein SCO1